MKRKIILASGSPRRKELLHQIGVVCDVVPSSYEEDMTRRMASHTLVQELAYGKAHDVAQKMTSGVVIGCDTFIEHRDTRIGKPKNTKDAKEILRRISDQTIMIYSGIAIIDTENDAEFVDWEMTRVKIARLSDKEIDDYIATGEPMDKAGAFALQGRGAVFIENIDGCYSNVIGLPLHKLYIGLQKLTIEV